MSKKVEIVKEKGRKKVYINGVERAECIARSLNDNIIIHDIENYKLYFYSKQDDNFICVEENISAVEFCHQGIRIVKYRKNKHNIEAFFSYSGKVILPFDLKLDLVSPKKKVILGGRIANNSFKYGIFTYSGKEKIPVKNDTIWVYDEYADVIEKAGSNKIVRYDLSDI